MNKEFVPYEIALSLKKIGFDKRCFGCYDEHGVFGLTVMSIQKYYTNREIDSWNVAAPTWSQVFRWFRKKHKLHGILFNMDTKDFGVEIRTIDNEPEGCILLGYFKTFKKAQLACLRKLIEIVKEKNSNGFKNKCKK